MKRLEELGVSPAPWSAKNLLGHRVFNSSGFEICDSDSAYSDADASFIAAAPKLYEGLMEAVIEMCGCCPSCGGYPDYDCNDRDRGCFVKEWRATLAEAAGEEACK